MFYPVKVFNGSGKKIKVVSSEVLSQRHWNLFEQNERKREYLFGRRKSEMHKQLKSYLIMEELCDGFMALQ